MAVKAIETEYKGHLMRSRLEARWAVFFDALGIAWNYEQQGYELPTGDRYLPDFRLPELGLWVEVKGEEMAFVADGKRYAAAAANLGGNGLLVLGPVPDCYIGLPQHFVLTKHDHCCGKPVLCWHVAWWEMLLHPTAVDEIGFPCTDLDSHRLDSLPGLRGYNAGRAKYTDPGAVDPEFPVPQACIAAYHAARSARFEHGQSGAVL